MLFEALGKKNVDFCIFKSDNNIDGKDNLNELPAAPAVYAICSRINGIPSNCRYVGGTNSLRESIINHFSLNEPDLCLRQFMQSIKIKTLDFILLPSHDSGAMNALIQSWKSYYKPECNEKINKVF